MSERIESQESALPSANNLLWMALGLLGVLFILALLFATCVAFSRMEDQRVSLATASCRLLGSGLPDDVRTLSEVSEKASRCVAAALERQSILSLSLGFSDANGRYEEAYGDLYRAYQKHLKLQE